MQQAAAQELLFEGQTSERFGLIERAKTERAKRAESRRSRPFKGSGFTHRHRGLW